MRTAPDGHALADAVEQRPYAAGRRQLQASYVVEREILGAALERANELPTHGLVEVRELLAYRSRSRRRPGTLLGVRAPGRLGTSVSRRAE